MVHLSIGRQIFIFERIVGRGGICGATSGFVVKIQESKFYRLKKALYGLKQALGAWNKRIHVFLKEIGFNKCVSENGVYVKKDENERVIIICLYVDDLLITSTDEGWTSKFKAELMKEFEMTNFGHMTYFFGIESHKSKNGVFMHQRRYALEIVINLKWNIVTLPLLLMNQGCNCQWMSMSRILVQLSIGGWLDPYLTCVIWVHIWLLVLELWDDSRRDQRCLTWQLSRGL